MSNQKLGGKGIEYSLILNWIMNSMIVDLIQWIELTKTERTEFESHEWMMASQIIVIVSDLIHSLVSLIERLNDMKLSCRLDQCPFMCKLWFVEYSLWMGVKRSDGNRDIWTTFFSFVGERMGAREKESKQERERRSEVGVSVTWQAKGGCRLEKKASLWQSRNFQTGHQVSFFPGRNGVQIKRERRKKGRRKKGRGRKKWREC